MCGGSGGGACVRAREWEGNARRGGGEQLGIVLEIVSCNFSPLSKRGTRIPTNARLPTRARVGALGTFRRATERARSSRRSDLSRLEQGENRLILVLVGARPSSLTLSMWSKPRVRFGTQVHVAREWTTRPRARARGKGETTRRSSLEYRFWTSRDSPPPITEDASDVHARRHDDFARLPWQSAAAARDGRATLSRGLVSFRRCYEVTSVISPSRVLSLLSLRGDFRPIPTTCVLDIIPLSRLDTRLGQARLCLTPLVGRGATRATIHRGRRRSRSVGRLEE